MDCFLHCLTGLIAAAAICQYVRSNSLGDQLTPQHESHVEILQNIGPASLSKPIGQDSSFLDMT